MQQAMFGQKLDFKAKYLNILCVLYTTFLLVASLLVHKMVSLGGITISASTLIFPFTYFLGDVIAEVYGYKVSRQLIWAAFMAIFIFDMLSALMIHLPSPSDWHHQTAFNTVVGSLPRTFLGDFFGLNIGAFVNIQAKEITKKGDFFGLNIGAFVNVYLITRLKVRLQGRLFWLRSLLSSAMGEASFNIIAFSVVFIGVIPFKDIVQAMLFSYVFKLVFAGISVIPATLMVRFLKRKEQLDVYDYQTNFNPFTLEI